MLGSIASRILAAALVAFVAIASSVLLCEGLARGWSADGHVSPREIRGARARALAGALGFALAAWIALGMVTHVR
ncbi:MAG TPA: hypothetical protein VML50_11700 [Anaeromyxobacter sp.]|nr:hypothetical protein [Anaeromyxobacter sp.]